ncbi:MAG: transposase [Candidatus Kerfeldbacteria bacterium]|nr:transposase [Candidatus Kerfeldbacteria bacterium]
MAWQNLIYYSFVMWKIKNIRLPKYNYRTNGWYFVTIVTNWRKKYLAGHENIIREELSSTIQGVGGVSADTFIIMPDHVHAIFVLHHSTVTLGEFIRKFKAKVSRRMRLRVWQPNYYEHIIRHEEELNRIREYITNNPMKELLFPKSDQLNDQ